MVEKSEVYSAGPDLWSQFFTPVRHFGERVAEFFSPHSEAAATDDRYEICVELPGVSEKDVAIEVHGNRLTVTGEKRSAHEETSKNFYFSERVYGRFRRTFRLPDDADADKILATHKDGVLTIKIAKLAPKSAHAKKVEITAA